MGAIVVADPGPGNRAGGGRRYALPMLLLAGWAALFAYSAAYLTEDPPFRPQPADAGRAPDAGQAWAVPRRVVVLDAPGGPAEASKVPPRTIPGAAPAAGAKAVPAVPAATAATAAPPAGAVPDYVGVWGPTALACGASSRRRGYLPATITADRASAGRTVCSFRDGRRAGNAWTLAAACSGRGRRWTSQVRLVVDGDRLTWSSSRGTTSYVRCGRGAG